jgi:hypothetical protein
MNRESPVKEEQLNEEQLNQLKKIRDHCMHLFDQSRGWKFRIKGTPLIDEIQGVDWDHDHVIGKQYGNFHIDLCELTTTNETSITN